MLLRDDQLSCHRLERGASCFKISIHMRLLELVSSLFYMCGHHSVLQKSHERYFCLAVNEIMLLRDASEDRVKMGLPFE